MFELDEYKEEQNYILVVQRTISITYLLTFLSDWLLVDCDVRTLR